MSFSPTDRQKLAINGNGALLVSAAAGSGKTAVLVERILRLLTDPSRPVEANRLLVVTFTKAAAGEMRLRLTERLSGEVASHPGNLRLLRQQMLMQKATISTMDSFCYALVREFPEKTGLGGEFKLGTKGQLSVLESSAMDRMLEEMYDRGDGAMESLVEILGADRGDDSVIAAVNQIVSYIRSLPFPEVWMESVLATYRDFHSISDHRLMAVLFDRASHRVSDLLDRLRSTLALVEKDPAMLKARGEALSYRTQQMEQIQKALDERAWDRLRSLIAQYQTTRVPALPKGYDNVSLKEAVDTLRGACDKEVERLGKAFSISAADCVAQAQALLPHLETLLECVKRYLGILGELKQEKGLYDFADIEYAALHLLVERGEDGQVHPTPCAKTVSERFDEVLVDEFQDINQLQYAIFHALSFGGEDLFAVGDVKQSIYGFRQASPEIFLDLLEQVVPFDGTALRSKVILDQNFRSRAGVCQAVNHVFGLLMSPGAGGLRYDEEHRLVPGNPHFPPSDTPDAALHLLETKGCTQSAEELEADHVAKLIREKMSCSSVTDSSTHQFRPARYRDFAVLFRSKSKMKAFAHRLEQWGIPVWTDLQADLLGAKEVSVVRSLLRVIDNPLSDVALMAVMISPIFGFTADEIAQVRIKNRSVGLYAALTQAAKEEGKIARFLSSLEQYRLWAATLPCDRFLDRLYDHTGYLAMVQAMENGEQRRQNLLSLLEHAREAQAGGVRGLSGFLRYLNRLEQSGEAVPAGGGANESEDLVRLMTIHRSKGLQFPVCILAECSSEFNLSDAHAPIVLHRDGGIGLMVTDDATRLRRSTVLREAVSVLSRESSVAEELRVLYVAMTRAQEKLILLLPVKDAARAVSGVADRFLRDFSGAEDCFQAHQVLSAKSYADWLLACLLVHPSGEMLRRQNQLHLNPVAAEGAWEVWVRECADVDLTPSVQEKPEPIAPCQAMVSEIQNRLSYRYPFQALNGLAAKRSVSQLVKQQEGASAEFACQSRPAFLTRAGLTPAERGTALHAFMQYADYNLAAQSLQAERERLVERGFLTREQADGLDLDRLTRFFQSDLYQRIHRSPKVEREVRFMIEMPALELDESLPEWAAEETVMVQGVADCVFEEEGELVIVDYKTDRVKENRTLIERYAPQLELYARALGRTQPLSVKKTLIYSFWLGETIDVTHLALEENA